MAAPIPKKDRDEIKEYLKDLDLSEQTSTQISELISENLGIHVSQPTASRYKREIMDDGQETPQETPHLTPPADLQLFCRDFFEDEGFGILCDVARTGSPREKLEAIKLVLQYGYGKPSNDPYRL